MKLDDNQFKELLLESKAVNDGELEKLYIYSKNFRVSLQEAAVENGIISYEKLGELIASSLQVPFADLSRIVIAEKMFRIIPERIARRYKVIAFEEDTNEVKIGMADPKNSEGIAEMIAKKTAKKVTTYFVTERDIDKHLQLYRKDLQLVIDELLEGYSHGASSSIHNVPTEKIVDSLITAAYRDKASDIHIEPEDDDIVVRFRKDSILHDVLYLDKRLLGQIVTRIKVLSHLQTDEHLNPQDGKMRIVIDAEYVDVRVSILPVIEGEKVVLRLLSSKNRQLSLADLGMSEKDLKKVADAVSKDYGLILSTGPTGSGKTTSIYSILKTLNTREKNITTIEDPAEYRIKGVNQFQINVKTKLSFANGLRSLLRQDPNIIFVGEIRDGETAGIAVNAGMTGHLVLSTLHTNDAATTLPRLIDMKVEPFLVASTVNVIIGQRLVRKICLACRITVGKSRVEMLKHLSEKTLRKYFGKNKTITFYRGAGCRICHNTGYAGRIGIFEIMEMSEKIQHLITLKKNSSVIQKQAIAEGMTTMLEDGMRKVIEGSTAIEELLRVMKTKSL